MVAQDRWSLNTSGHKTGFTVYILLFTQCIRYFLGFLVLIFFSSKVFIKFNRLNMNGRSGILIRF